MEQYMSFSDAAKQKSFWNYMTATRLKEKLSSDFISILGRLREQLQITRRQRKLMYS